jgi:hypothetical protein
MPRLLWLIKAHASWIYLEITRKLVIGHNHPLWKSICLFSYMYKVVWILHQNFKWLQYHWTNESLRWYLLLISKSLMKQKSKGHKWDKTRQWRYFRKELHVLLPKKTFFIWMNFWILFLQIVMKNVYNFLNRWHFFNLYFWINIKLWK